MMDPQPSCGSSNEPAQPVVEYDNTMAFITFVVAFLLMIQNSGDILSQCTC